MKNVLTICNEEIGVVSIYNTKIKTYKNGLVKSRKKSYDIFKGISRDNRHNGTSSNDDLDRYLKKHIKERREKIIDLALNNNHWEYFVTLTFSDAEIGEYSHEKAINLLRKWIDNQKHQNKNMSYMIVSEFHKSGRLHFHGLFANVPKWQLTEARSPKTNRKIIIDGLQIYNLSNYKLGFTTVSLIKSQERVSVYLSKYISKEIINIKNKKTFWYSKDLEKPKINFSYLEGKLEDYYKNEKILYNEEFKTDNSLIECVDVELPIIDIMLTSIFLFIYTFY